MTKIATTAKRKGGPYFWLQGEIFLAKNDYTPTQRLMLAVLAHAMSWDERCGAWVCFLSHKELARRMGLSGKTTSTVRAALRVITQHNPRHILIRKPAKFGKKILTRGHWHRCAQFAWVADPYAFARSEDAKASAPRLPQHATNADATSNAPSAATRSEPANVTLARRMTEAAQRVTRRELSVRGVELNAEEWEQSSEQNAWREAWRFIQRGCISMKWRAVESALEASGFERGEVPGHNLVWDAARIASDFINAMTARTTPPTEHGDGAKVL